MIFLALYYYVEKLILIKKNFKKSILISNP